MQRLLNWAAWDADGVRDDVRAYVAGHLGCADGVLVAGETGFPKKEDQVRGVQRQYSGTAGRVENCQLGVFCVYATSKGRALIDRELYRPKSRAGDRDRGREAAGPDEMAFAAKTELARTMLGRALEAGVPAAWVTADEAYGKGQQVPRLAGTTQDRLCGRRALRPGTAGSAGISRADILAAHAPARAWKRLSCGQGAKGPRIFDWAAGADTRPAR